MSERVASDRRPASPLEVIIWSVVALLAGSIPGLGLAVGLVLAATRLRGNRVARIAVPVLGTLSSVVLVLGLIIGSGGSGVGPLGTPV